MFVAVEDERGVGLGLRVQRVLLGVVSLVLVVWVLLAIYVLVSPLYVLEGPVSGRVALLWYELWFFGEPLVHPALDAVQVYCYVLVLAVVFGVEGAGIALYGVLRGAVPSRTMGGFVVSSSLVLLVASGAARGIVLLVSRITGVVARNYTYTTSAGTIVFPPERVLEGQALHIVVGGGLMGVAVVAVAVSIAWYLVAYRGRW